MFPLAFLTTIHRFSFLGGGSTPTPPVTMAGVTFQAKITLASPAQTIAVTSIPNTVKSVYFRAMLINALNALNTGSFKINGTATNQRRMTYTAAGGSPSIDTNGFQMAGGPGGTARTFIEGWVECSADDVLALSYRYRTIAENNTDFVQIGIGEVMLAAAPSASLASFTLDGGAAGALNTNSWLKWWTFDEA